MTTAVFARVQRVCSLFILFTSLACLPACGAVISLAAGGRPMAVIVVAPDAHPRLMLAADELQHYVERICGVTLPISTTGEKAQETGLYIGNCAPTQESDLPAAGMNPETYAVTVRDGDIYFTGHHPTPTYFAVASFIEDDLGVRWFAPGPDWEYVPAETPGNLAVNVRSRVVVPDTSPRIWSGHAWNPNWSTWNLRNKTVLSEVVPRRQFQNYLHRIFTVEKYGESNPEFFPLINGVRYLPVNDNNWRPCESNPEVLRITVEYARRFFDENPNIDSFSLGMDDIYRMCSCENCRAMDAHPDSYERQQFSDRHYKFVNAVAREIAKTHPDRYIGTLIYHIARDLPETVDRLEDNVFGFITETSALWWEPGRKAADMALTREWAKRCRHLSRYDYYGMGGITPRVYPHAMAEQIKFDKSLGLEGMYIEVYTFLPNTAPMIYALSKLQWDASLDVDRLLGEFYARMFGPAAGTMKEYFNLLERSWNTPRPGRRGWVHRNLVTQALAMSAEDVDEGMRLLHRALRQADDELTKKRIRTVQAGLRYGGYAIHTYAHSEKLRTMPIRTEADAREILDGFEALVRLGIERERYWQAAWRRDDLLGETVRGLGGMGYLAVNQVPRLEVGANSAALRVVSWYENNAPDKLLEIVAHFGEQSHGTVANAIEGWLWVRKHNPPNLLANPGFEERAANEETAEHDWVTAGAPKGWSTWTAAPGTVFEVQGGQGRDGSRAAAVRSGASGTYIQVVPVQPGERFVISAWTRANTPAASAKAHLGVRWQLPDGKWHPERDKEPLTMAVAGVPGWQIVVLTAQAPEGAGRMLVMPSARELLQNEVVYFDDLAAYRIGNYQ